MLSLKSLLLAMALLAFCLSSVSAVDCAFDDTEDCGTTYVKGKATGNNKQCVKIDGNPVVVSTACAFMKMKEKAKADGVNLKLNSGFRTMAEQEHLYKCYQTKKCNHGNLAAKPGFSNHQNGIALDISVSQTKTYNWLVAHAKANGFIRTVPSEKWHWEHRPGQKCNAIVKYSCKN
ncbi:hypothetical protein HDU97_006013 [Phlyctochytrium planicorne]|nr:hypothetical protein HDU97_006013 [Phlyctochytrium planicorne]